MNNLNCDKVSEEHTVGSLLTASGPFNFFFFFPTRVGTGGSYLRFFSLMIIQCISNVILSKLFKTFDKILTDLIDNNYPMGDEINYTIIGSDLKDTIWIFS